MAPPVLNKMQGMSNPHRFYRLDVILDLSRSHPHFPSLPSPPLPSPSPSPP